MNKIETEIETWWKEYVTLLKVHLPFEHHPAIDKALATHPLSVATLQPEVKSETTNSGGESESHLSETH